MPVLLEHREACTVLLVSIICLPLFAAGLPRGSRALEPVELTLDPMEAVVYAGEDITFTCSAPTNVTLKWDYNMVLHPKAITTGITVVNGTDQVMWWSRLTIRKVKRHMTGEIGCSADGTTKAIAFLIVKGVKIGGSCISNDDCITQNAICNNGQCGCPKSDILLRIADTGYEVCRKMSFRLYDPCILTEECFQFVDRKSVCSTNGICVCAPWSTDVNGKCVSKSELTYSKNQELYRVGLVAITCLIIIIVSISLWITLRKSCRQRNAQIQRNLSQDAVADRASGVIRELSDDKPPSYDDVLESTDNISSPPNFKEALTSSMTAKRLLRQVSAPAGQLLSKTTSISLNQSAKTSESSLNSRPNG